MSHCKALLDFVARGSHKHAEQKHKEEREAGKSTVKMTEKKKNVLNMLAFLHVDHIFSCALFLLKMSI